MAAEGSLAVLPAAESNQLAGSAAGSRAGSTRPTATGEGASSSGLASQQPRGSASGSARPTVTGDGGISSSASQLAGSTRPTVTGDGSSSNVGGGGGRASHLHEHVEAGLGCLGPAVSQGRLSREDILQVRTLARVQACRGLDTGPMLLHTHLSGSVPSQERP